MTKARSAYVDAFERQEDSWRALPPRFKEENRVVAEPSLELLTGEMMPTPTYREEDV